MKSKVLKILLSAVLAFALWTYVVTVVHTESTDVFPNIPVVLDGQSILTERGLMITDTQTPTVTLTLAGNRSDLKKLSSTNIKLIADLSKITETGEQRINYSISYPEGVSTGAIQVVSRNPQPQYVTVNVEREVKKEVPVTLSYVGTVAEDYIVDKENRVLDRETITIQGPEPVIAQIAQAKVEIDLTDRVESFMETYRIQLCDENGEPVDATAVETNVAEVSVTMKIQRVKEIPLVVTVVSGGGATEETSKVTINPQTIKVSGSESVLSELTELNIGTIRLGELEQDKQWEMAIELPNGVTNLTNILKAEISVSFPDLLKKTFTITQITPLNVPSGMEAEIFTQEIAVTVRGPRELVAIMTAADITVTVDFAGAEMGTATMKADITLGRSFGSVGAVGSYTVPATLREKTETEEQ